MNLQLNGKTALVTGSTAGIGLAIATALAEEGASVIVNGRTEERVESAVKRSGATYGIAADLGTESGARAVTARFPELDILVNNLGIFEAKPFEQISDDDWRRFPASRHHASNPAPQQPRSRRCANVLAWRLRPVGPPDLRAVSRLHCSTATEPLISLHLVHRVEPVDVFGNCDRQDGLPGERC